MEQDQDYQAREAATAAAPVLAANDAFDLAIISARFQDALIRPVDMGYDRTAKRFALLANRFMHERRPDLWGRILRVPGWRRRAGLHFNHVVKVESRDIPDRQDVESVLSLLAVEFTAHRSALDAEPVQALVPGRDFQEEATESRPALDGEILLTFAGGPQIRLTVEALDAEARDLGTPWRASRTPHHKI